MSRRTLLRRSLFRLLCASVVTLAVAASAASVAQEAVSEPWVVATSTGKVSAPSSGLMPGEGCETGSDGQMRISGPGKSQIRLREDASLHRKDDATWEIRAGLVGFRFDPASGPLPLQTLTTPFARAECRDGLFVIKIAPHLVRIAVLRGTAEITGSGGVRRHLESKQECAATMSALSAPYVTNDDLYFAWYWDK